MKYWKHKRDHQTKKLKNKYLQNSLRLLMFLLVFRLCLYSYTILKSWSRYFYSYSCFLLSNRKSLLLFLLFLFLLYRLTLLLLLLLSSSIFSNLFTAKPKPSFWLETLELRERLPLLIGDRPELNSDVLPL